MATKTSDFLLLFRETTPERYDQMSREERREALDRWNAWCDGIAGDGRLQSGHTLGPEGRTIAAAAGRAGASTLDGPFSEAKEVVGGYLLLTADSLDEAEAIARECPLLQYGMVVEARPVAEACHLARSLGWETMRETAGETAEQPA